MRDYENRKLKNIPEVNYTMGPNKQVLRIIEEEKDIGVIIDNKLEFSSHMS